MSDSGIWFGTGWKPGQCEGCEEWRRVARADCYEERVYLCRVCLDDLAEEVAAFADRPTVAQDGQGLAKST